ncbi:MAG: tRNA-dihydrouridine synthase family protein [Deltaproteobacteria bacterium]|nr:tRNA-dihydrouridine synthase family protein [Deltaproteobacteria bacterium]
MVFPFDPPIVLAPMEGVTHPEMRRILSERGGVGLVCTEFVRIHRGDLSAKHLRSQVVRAPGVPLCVQVMGNDIDKMRDAARVVSAAGADVVDLNLGCPSPRVVRHGVGAAMLKDLGLLRRVLEAMRAAVPGLLSAKIRAGFDDKDNVLAIAKAVEESGVDYVVVHPRTRSDYLRGVADWRTIRMVKQSLRIPVVGNGDCWYAEDAFRMREETGCDAVMIGRPALRNPWIFRQIDQLDRGLPVDRPSGADVVEFIDDVVERLHRAFPESNPIGKTKELLQYLGRAVLGAPDFKRTVLRIGSLQEILAYSKATLSSLPAAAFDLGSGGSHESSGRAAD